MRTGFYIEIFSESHAALGCAGPPSKHVDLRNRGQTIPRTLTDLGGLATASSSLRMMCEWPPVLFLRQAFEGYTRDMIKTTDYRITTSAQSEIRG
jgi:hypothetical protein